MNLEDLPPSRAPDARPLTAVLFDWGGTLVDFPGVYQPGHVQCLRAFHDELAATPALDGVPWPAFQEAYQRCARAQLARYQSTRRELHLEDRMAETLRAVGREGRAEPADMVAQLSRHLVAGSRMVDGAPEVLARLSGCYRLGLVSNYPHAPTVVGTLERFGLLGHLQGCVVISGDVGWTKPHPEPFRRALERVGAAPGECLFVGDDAENDVRGAAALGMSTAWLAPPGAPEVAEATWRLARLRDLPAVLGLGAGI